MSVANQSFRIGAASGRKNAHVIRHAENSGYRHDIGKLEPAAVCPSKLARCSTWRTWLYPREGAKAAGRGPASPEHQASRCCRQLRLLGAGGCLGGISLGRITDHRLERADGERGTLLATSDDGDRAESHELLSLLANVTQAYAICSPPLRAALRSALQTVAIGVAGEPGRRKGVAVRKGRLRPFARSQSARSFNHQISPNGMPSSNRPLIRLLRVKEHQSSGSTMACNFANASATTSPDAASILRAPRAARSSTRH